MVEELYVGDFRDFILGNVDFVQALELLKLFTELLARHVLVAVD